MRKVFFFGNEEKTPKTIKISEWERKWKNNSYESTPPAQKVEKFHFQICFSAKFMEKLLN